MNLKKCSAFSHFFILFTRKPSLVSIVNLINFFFSFLYFVYCMRELEFVIWWLKNWSWKWQNVTLCTSETHTETGKKKQKNVGKKTEEKFIS